MNDVTKPIVGILIVCLLVLIMMPIVQGIMTTNNVMECGSLLEKFGYWVLAAGHCVPGTLSPCSDATYDLGAVGQRWRNGYLSGNLTAAGYVNTNTSYPVVRGATKVVVSANATAQWRRQGDIICDQVADQTEINAALAGGGLIQLSDGTFIISNTINIPSNTILQGVGTATRIYLASTSNSHMLVNAIAGNSNIVIKDVLMDGNGPNQTPWHDIINLNTVDHFRIDNVFLQYPQEACITLNSCHDGFISPTVCMGTAHIASGDGIAVELNCYNITIVGGEYYAMESGIELEQNSFNIDIYSPVSHNNTQGITIQDSAVTGGPDYVRIFSPNCYYNTQGIWILSAVGATDGVTHVDIVEPSCHDNIQDGFKCDGQAAALIEDVNIRGGWLNNNGRYGFNITQSLRVRVSPQTETFNNVTGPFNVGTSTYTSYDGGSGNINKSLLTPYMEIGTTTTQVLDVIGRVWITPLVIKERTYIDRLYLMINAASAGNIVQGIYADNGYTPAGGAVLVETASTAAPGTYRIMVNTVATTELVPGIYWVATESDSNTLQTTKFSPAVQVSQPLGAYFYDRGGGYGALTNPCPAVTANITMAIYAWAGKN